MKNKIEELIGFIYAKSRELVEKNTQLAPMIYLITPEGKNIGVLAPNAMQSEENKDVFSAHIKLLAKKEDAVALVFVSESWTIPQNKVEEFMMNRALYPSVASFPGKVSCLMVTVEEKGCAGRLGIALIDESTSNKKLGPLDFIVPDLKKGRFSNFLGTEILN